MQHSLLIGEILYVSLFAFFFFTTTLFHFYGLQISHFLTPAIKYMCFSFNAICLFCFLSLALAISFFPHPTVDNKIQSKRLAFVVVVVFSLEKFRWPCDLLPKHANFTPAYMKGYKSMDRQFCQNQNLLDEQITKFSNPRCSPMTVLNN